jgi:Holliday junction resolvase RusA-like endonuclease
MLTFNLPEPPSVNHYKVYARAGAPVSTRKYRDWKEEAGWEIRRQSVGKQKWLEGPLQVELVFAQHGDIDNRIKPLLDLMQACGVFENDKQVERLVAQFGEAPGRCRVTLLPVVGTVK